MADRAATAEPIAGGIRAGLAQILAWDLGDSVSGELMEPTRRLAARLQSVPETPRRPTFCLPREDIWQYSRIADLLVLEPPGPNSSFPLARSRPLVLAACAADAHGHSVLGVDPHAGPPAGHGPGHARWAAKLPPAWTLEPEQIRLLAYHAIASGARGLWFRSDSRLDATDRQTRSCGPRSLEWLNLELQMLRGLGGHGHSTKPN